MGDGEIVETTDACAIPKWAPQKSLRYEVDDFIVSPPSNEDGGFFHLRFGRRTSPRPSTYDRINKELSMTVEIKDGDPLISEVNLFGPSEQAVANPSIKITPTGLSPTITPEVEAESSKSRSTKPLFVFHLRDSKGSIEETEKLTDSGDSSSSPFDLSDSLTSALNKVSLEKSESSESSSVLVEKKNTLTPEEPDKVKGRLTPDRHIRKETLPKEQMPLANINLLEKVQSLPVTSPVDVTPYTTPLTTPHSSPHAKRKIYGVVMEQSTSHSYFCTKPFLGSRQTSESSQAFASGGGDGVSLSETSAQMTQHLETGSRVAMAMEPGQKLAKKRRPKPSTLREMNFWAPTSM